MSLNSVSDSASPSTVASRVVTMIEHLEKPTGRVILSIKGKIKQTNSDDGVARFDREMLAKLPQQTVKTTELWSDGMQEFEGVLLTDLLKYVGATGNYIVAYALDGYDTDPIPLTDLDKYSVLVAIKNNGHYMRIRDKGPVRLVYPVDDFPELQKDPKTQYKLIWHLRTLTVN
ncbi:molybdopterin-dependent oxidoreductase [Beggiatoa alba]|uniref:molybdopterin-dependent oxidoreductase n=1 Tax=Beggiatoa alba TaxID=1022 RepID=UPI0018DEE119|nr:molybdopterin-dependent oxidoreductase [Beggiatoa alba]